MTPEEALSILDRVAAVACMNRQDHLNAQQALQTLRTEIAALRVAVQEKAKRPNG